MKEQGFSLIQLIIALAIIGILLSLATLNFNAMRTKGMIESEAVTIYSKLTELRLQALYTKTGRAALIGTDRFSIYSSQVTTVAPMSIVTLRYPVVADAAPLLFDAGGMMLGEERSICVDPSGTLATNAGNTYSVELSATKIFLGKRESGGACAKAYIAQK